MIRLFAPAALAAALLALPLVATAESAAVLAVTLIDTSTEGDMNPPRADEAARVEMLERDLAAAFAEQGWTLVDTAPVAADLAERVNPADCNGCDARLAARLGADVAVTGEVQKVSNLILTINVLVREADSATLIAAGNADIRGNTDQSWRRGLSYVLRNRVFPQLAARD